MVVWTSATGYGETDWWLITGIQRRTFIENEDMCSGQSNMHFALERILRAVAQAELLCQAAGRKLKLSELNATSSEVGYVSRTKSRQHVKLQRLNVEPSARVTLQTVLSELTSISIDINDFCKPGQLEEDARKIEDSLRLLLSSSELKELILDSIDDGDATDENLSNTDRQDDIWIGDRIISMITTMEKSHCLKAPRPVVQRYGRVKGRLPKFHSKVCLDAGSNQHLRILHRSNIDCARCKEHMQKHIASCC